MPILTTCLRTFRRVLLDEEATHVSRCAMVADFPHEPSHRLASGHRIHRVLTLEMLASTRLHVNSFRRLNVQESRLPKQATNQAIHSDHYLGSNPFGCQGRSPITRIFALLPLCGADE